jgi:GNAT superfamily N-acetyltransferase
MIIRAAAPADASAVAEVFLASRRSAAAYLPNTVHTEEEDRWFVREVLIGTLDTWLAEDTGGRVAALLSLGDGWIHQLYVHPEHAGRGIGGALVDHAKRLYPDGLQLWTFASNSAARRFYERHGFAAVEFTDGASNEERAPDVRYVWDPASP